MTDPNSQLGFDPWELSRSSRHPAASKPQLAAWTSKNEATTDAHDESERARRDRGFRLLSYSLIGAALLFYVGISYVMGWGSFR